MPFSSKRRSIKDVEEKEINPDIDSTCNACSLKPIEEKALSKDEKAVKVGINHLTKELLNNNSNRKAVKKGILKCVEAGGDSEMCKLNIG